MKVDFQMKLVKESFAHLVSYGCCKRCCIMKCGLSTSECLEFIYGCRKEVMSSH